MKEAEDLKRIIDTESMDRWVRYSSIATRPADISELQDIFAHSEVGVINKLFIPALSPKNAGRSAIIFAVNKIMGGDALLDLVDKYARDRFNRDWEAHWSELDEREAKITAKYDAFNQTVRDIKEGVAKVVDQAVHQIAPPPSRFEN